MIPSSCSLQTLTDNEQLSPRRCAILLLLIPPSSYKTCLGIMDPHNHVPLKSISAKNSQISLQFFPCVPLFFFRRENRRPVRRKPTPGLAVAHRSRPANLTERRRLLCSASRPADCEFHRHVGRPQRRRGRPGDKRPRVIL